MIFDQTGIALSHVTLKRIWGKVRYDSLPRTNTLNTIVRFLGYRNWREFRVNNASGPLAIDAGEGQNSFFGRSSALVTSTVNLLENKNFDVSSRNEAISLVANCGIDDCRLPQTDWSARFAFPNPILCVVYFVMNLDFKIDSSITFLSFSLSYIIDMLNSLLPNSAIYIEVYLLKSSGLMFT